MSIYTNLVSYWSFDESSGNASDTVSGNTLTNNNTVTYSSAKIRNGITTASSGTKYMYIENASQTGLDITGDLSISIWFKTSSNVVHALSFMGVGTDGYGISIGDAGGASGKLSIFRNSWTYGNTTVNDNSWKHVVVSFSGQIASIYVNGSLDATSSALGSPVSYTGRRSIGADRSGGKNFDGQIDEVAIWSRAITSGEVTTLYNSGTGVSLMPILLSDTLLSSDVISMLRTSVISTSESLSLSEFNLTDIGWNNMQRSTTTWTNLSKT